jgi:hypothetical protein
LGVLSQLTESEILLALLGDLRFLAAAVGLVWVYIVLHFQARAFFDAF